MHQQSKYCSPTLSQLYFHKFTIYVANEYLKWSHVKHRWHKSRSCGFVDICTKPYITCIMWNVCNGAHDVILTSQPYLQEKPFVICLHAFFTFFVIKHNVYEYLVINTCGVNVKKTWNISNSSFFQHCMNLRMPTNCLLYAGDDMPVVWHICFSLSICH